MVPFILFLLTIYLLSSIYVFLILSIFPPHPHIFLPSSMQLLKVTPISILPPDSFLIVSDSMSCHVMSFQSLINNLLNFCLCLLIIILCIKNIPLSLHQAGFIIKFLKIPSLFRQ